MRKETGIPRMLIMRRDVAWLLVLVVLVTAALIAWRGSADRSASPYSHAVKPKVRVLIDPGHGGIDGGTNRDGILEKDINLALGLQLQRALTAQGCDAFLSRESDVDLGGQNSGNRWRRDLEARVQKARDLNAQLMVSLHVNSSRKSTERGPLVFYAVNSADSKRLAAAVLDSLSSVARPNMTQPVGARFYILRQAPVPAILVEAGFLTNPEDRRQMLDPAQQQQVAEAIASGILRYLAEPAPPSP